MIHKYIHKLTSRLYERIGLRADSLKMVHEAAYLLGIPLHWVKEDKDPSKIDVKLEAEEFSELSNLNFDTTTEKVITLQ